MTKPLAPGTLLLSVPQMLDRNFMHTVVLLCEHTAEGAYGLVVNKLTEYTVAKLMPEHPVLAGAEFPVFSGGPVGLDTLQFVHRVPDLIPDSHEIGEGLFIGGAIEALAEYIALDAGAAKNARAFIGYSGWMGGQLDMELSSGSWLQLRPFPELTFSSGDAEAVWRRAMRELGDEGEQLSHLPPDVSWN